MNFNNENNDMYDELDHNLSNNRATNTLKNKATGIMKSAGKKILKAGVKAIKAALSKMLIFLGPYLGILIGLIVLFSVGYYFILEERGSTSTYTFENEEGSEKELNDKGYFVGTQLGEKNNAILEFYKHLAKNKSFWQIIGNDKEDLIQDPNIRDYYGQEENYSLSSNFLFTLDEFLYRQKYRYPEQFLKPVNYDKKTLELVQLTEDQNRTVTAKSVNRDDKTGLKTNKSVIGTWDYGLGTVYDYKKEERTEFMKGTITSREVWSGNGVTTVPANDPFLYELDGYPEDIWLIQTATTFKGKYTLKYEVQEKELRDLQEGNTDIINSTITRYHYADHVETYECGTNSEGEPTYCSKTYPLYEYRTGSVYEKLPVLVETEEPDKEINMRYLEDYLWNFESWVPDTAMENFDFFERVGTMINSNIEIGTEASGGAVEKAMQFYSIAEKTGKAYGVEADLIIAMIAQESAGNPKINKDGLAQITDISCKVSGTKLDGTSVNLNACNVADRQNPEIAIEYLAIRLSNSLKKYNGDMVKAIQAYNMPALFTYIEEHYPGSTSSMEWLNYREEARLYYGQKELGVKTRSANYNCLNDYKSDKNLPIYGDVCYVEHVLAKYQGDALKGLDKISTSENKEENGFFNSLKKGINNLFNISTKEYSEDEKHIYYSHKQTAQNVEEILTSVVTFEKKISFSEAGTDRDEKISTVGFWDSGSSGILGSLNFGDLAEFASFANQSGLIPPVDMNDKNLRISSQFGMRWGSLHTGIDVAGPIGTGLYAVDSGIVKKSYSECSPNGGYYGSRCGVAGFRGYGNVVYLKLDSGGYVLYAHMAQVAVQEGQSIAKGQLVGTLGHSGSSTGAHLHFEYRKSDNKSTAIDPSILFSRPMLSP